MFFKIVILFISLVSIFWSAEFSFVEPVRGKMSVDDYFNTLGMPDL